MRSLLLLAAALLPVGGCASKWNTLDLDGDGFTVAEGDCFEGEGGEAIYPGAPEIPYDGIDGDCMGGSDYDADGDGHDAVEYGGDDCWDLPGSYPDGFVAVSGTTQLEPGEVYPGAAEVWYDGIDGDCSGGSDFDQDLDGFDSAAHAQVDGSYGDDCYDVVDPDCDTYDADDTDCDYPLSGALVGDPFAPEEINPAAGEVWYDGTDQDCDSHSDYDQDRDGFDISDECDDLDPAVFPDDSVEEIWGNCIDENCDGNFADQDGDGWLASGVETSCPDELDEVDLRYLGDCYDDPADAGDWQALDGFSDPAADDVNPGAYDQPYDGLDGDCGGGDDFDADGDGHRSDTWPDAEGSLGDDCDDARGDVYPGALDAWYDGLDADCAGNDDYDQDVDGYQDPSSGTGTDCNDTDANVNPGMDELCSTPSTDDNCDGSTNDVDAVGCSLFYRDVDGDAHAGATSECLCVADTTYAYTTSDDCDDGNSAIHPGATETCATSGVDDDCDGSANDVNATGCTYWYNDTDGDGHGTTTRTCRCSSSTTYTATVGDDCDDGDSTAYPGATETCDGVDDDCDGTADDGLPLYYLDSDRDGHGDDTDAGSCQTSGRVSNHDDCDDSDATIYTGATETCDGDDDDCDGTADDGLPTYYTDSDRDGYGSGGAGCQSGAGRSSNNNDCDDTRAAVNPAATETCTTTYDDDCDGSANDEGATACTNHYFDADNDDYGTSASRCVCTDDGSYRGSASGDCDDTNSAVHPGATEVCNTVDDDCDGTPDDGVQTYADLDGDGQGAGTGGCSSGAGYVSNDDDCDDADDLVYLGAPELCDGMLNDCADEGTWDVGDEDGTVSAVNAAGDWSVLGWSKVNTATTSASFTADTDVYICPGTYYVRISATTGYDINLIGSDSVTTVIDANGTGPALTLSGGGSSTATGLTFQNGVGTTVLGVAYGGAVYLNASVAPASPTLTMDDCVVTGSSAGASATGSGGGIAVRGAAWLDATATEISGNDATDGAGVAVMDTAQVTFSGVAVTANTASHGGGIHLTDGAMVELVDSNVYQNSANQGGGLWVDEGTFTLSCGVGSYGVYDNDATGSSAHGAGAFVGFSSTAMLDVTNCDWGTGGTDNSCSGSCGDDVDVQITSAPAYTAYRSYGNNVSFICTGGKKGTCVP